MNEAMIKNQLCRELHALIKQRLKEVEGVRSVISEGPARHHITGIQDGLVIAASIVFDESMKHPFYDKPPTT